MPVDWRRTDGTGEQHETGSEDGRKPENGILLYHPYSQLAGY
jgi:hypothetical protein